MFQKIFNPITKKWVFINSKKGKEILKLHLLYFLKLKGGESLYDMIIDKNDTTTTNPPLDINLLNFC